MNPSARLRELKLLIPQCLLKDQLRLGTLLTRWMSDHPGQTSPPALEQWLAQARASVALRKERQAQLPAIHYPPALPITARAADIVSAIRNNQVLVIAGETGSGKTTQLPKMCLEAGLGIRARIGCTQPRRVAATAVSRRLAEELGFQWGREVGCKIRFSDETGPDTCVKFMTDGILLAEAQGDPFLSEYEAIILDEAHERSLNIDFLLGWLKHLLAQRQDLRLIISSATIDTKAFSHAFQDAPIIEVSGRVYPVEVIYEASLKTEEEEGDFSYVEAAVQAVERILIESPPGDVLVFMPGERDIIEMRDALESCGVGHLDLVPLFGRLSLPDQERIFASSARTKIVIATNIAETSLTVPGIRYVVDTGLARISRYNSRTRTKRLPIEAISQSSANQRKGRCGRVADGVCVRLYSQADFEARPPYTQPEIQRANLAEVILRLKSTQFGEIETFPFINPPTTQAIAGGYELLHELGALDSQQKLTELGRQLARLPVDPTVGRMILQAQTEGVVKEVLIIAAGLSIQDPRLRPLDQPEAAVQAHRRFLHPKSDFLTLLNIWNAFHDRLESLRTQSSSRKFCAAHFLSYPRMREWRDLHAQLEEAVSDLGNSPRPHQPPDYAAIHRSILTGLWGHVASRKDRNIYQLGGNRDVMLFPGSCLFERSEPDKRRAQRIKEPSRPQTTSQPAWVAAGEIVETSRLFLRTAAEIDSAWILELASHLCRRAYLEPQWSSLEGRVRARERITLRGLLVLERMVSYGPVNPLEATEMFIRSALVEEGLAEHFHPRDPKPGLRTDHSHRTVHRGSARTHSLRQSSSQLASNDPDAVETSNADAPPDLTGLPARYGFLQHNRQLRQKIEIWQTQLPHRLVADLDEAMFDAYARQVSNVSSVPELNRLLDERKTESHCLQFKAEDLLGPHAAAFDSNSFPDHLRIGSQSVPVSYAYAPGQEHDGITVRLPFTLAEVIDPAALDWAVPALREPRILHLLQALPKPLRRSLMPLGPKAKELAQAVEPTGGAFLPALTAYIREHYQVTVGESDWSTAALPSHLSPCFEVLGPDHKPVLSSRDVGALKAELRRQDFTTQTPDWQAATKRWERYGLKDWTVGDLPPEVPIGHVAELSLRAFPALKWEAGEISLRLFREVNEAGGSHAQALPHLMESVLQKELAWMQKDLRGLSKWRDLFVTLGPIDELEASAFLNLKSHLLGPRPVWPRTAAGFAALLQETRERMRSLVPGFIDIVGEVLKGRQAILLYRKPYPRLLQDLNALVPPHFLRAVPFQRLPHLPRYLKALLIRAERAAVNGAKDQEKAARILPYVDALSKLPAIEPGSEAESKRQACRWLIEEYRVSIFAQELGTAEPVSPKRIEQALADLQRT